MLRPHGGSGRRQPPAPAPRRPVAGQAMGVAGLSRCPAYRAFAISDLDRNTPARHGSALRGRVMSGRIACVALASALGVVSFSQARAASWLEKNFWLSGPRYDRVMPACDYAPALDRIIANFGTKEVRFWNSELRSSALRISARPPSCRGPRSRFRAASAAARR